MPTPVVKYMFKEEVGDLFVSGANLLVITTNPIISSHGGVVMGRGCARQARDMFRGIDKRFADQIRKNGNHVCLIWDNPQIISFPVKHHWKNMANLNLIQRSVQELLLFVGEHDVSIAMPRPGCNNGRLDWEEVKPLLLPLDERYTVYSLP